MYLCTHGCVAEWNLWSMGVCVSQGQDTRMMLRDSQRHPYDCWVDFVRCLLAAITLLTLLPSSVVIELDTKEIVCVVLRGVR